MAFEELLDQVGSIGRFHILQIVLIFFHVSLSFAHFLLGNFSAAIPGHRCWVRILDNDTVSSNDTGILGQDALLRVFIPLDSHQRPESCRRFVHPQWQLLHFNKTFPDVGEPDTEPCLDGWVYDLSYFPSTIVTEWDLVCEYQTLTQVAQILTMTGGFLGSIISGPVSDRFGRKWSLKWSLLLLAVSGTCTAFAPTFHVYCSMRLLAGVAFVVIMQNGFILAMEWTSPQYISAVLTVISSFSGVGQMILGGVAFVFRDWHTLYLVMSIPFFLLFLFSRWQMESARWLITINKHDEGLKILKKFADMNGKKIAEEALNIEVLRSTMRKELEPTQTRTTYCDFFYTPNMRKNTCFLLLLRILVTVPFYGILTNIQHLGNNIFLYQGLYGAFSLLSQFFALFLMNRMSYKFSELFLLILEGLFILANTVVSKEMQILNITLLSAAFFFSTGVRSVINIHSVGLQPTVLRARSSSLNSVVSTFGSIMAPLLMTLQTFSALLPWIIYGVLPIIACLAVFFLPETKNMPLPDTIQDVENYKTFRRKAGKEDSSIKVTKF